MSQKTYLEVGVVRGIYRYPVKSLAGEPIQESWIGWHGVEGDRRFAFVKQNSRRGFPWFTARDNPKLLQYRPYFVEPDALRNSAVHVLTPDGLHLPVNSPELLAEMNTLSRVPVYLLHNWSGIYDAMDVSLISTASIQWIGQQSDETLPAERFRPNLLVEAFDARDFPEEQWLKHLLVFGDRDQSARIRINRKTVRCMVVNVQEQSAKQNPAVLKSLVEQRRNCLGVYGTIERPGNIRVGDVIRLLKA